MKRIFIKSRVYLLLIISSFIIASAVEAKSHYQITHVKSWDSLNLRNKPGIKSKVVAKIPANVDSIALSGEKVAVGKTIWVKIDWQGQQGWVSEYFLKPTLGTNARVSGVKKRLKPAAKKDTIKQAKSGAKPVDKGIGKNQWILRCSNKTPFWRVDVYPKALKIFTGKYKALLPITYKKQEKNKWNTAKRTHLKGGNAKDKVDLDIRYSYQRCNDALSKQKVPFVATVIHNGKEMKGCCRALKIN